MHKGMKLLIDSDIILYRGLFVCEGYYPGIRACDNIVTSIIERFDCPYELVLTGSGNFRKKIYPEYKAHRKDSARPKYLYEGKQYLKKYWNAVETVGFEADDYIAMNYEEGDVIVSSDKDFKQLKARIYNPNKDEFTDVHDPSFYFWLQTMVGDLADNIPGLPNPEKAHHKNKPCFTEGTATPLLEGKSNDEMRELVVGLYKEVYGEDWFFYFDRNCSLLFLRRKDKVNYYEVF